MTVKDKYSLKLFLCVFGPAGVLVVFGVICYVIVNLSPGDKPINSASFEVVDKYKECDVVRYAPHQVAEYKYFLYCEKNK